MARLKFPSAYTILFFLTIVMAVPTWVVPAGQYQMTTNEDLGREVPVAGTYHIVEASPQGFADVVLAPIDDFYNHSTYSANAIDVALFVLIIGGFLGVATQTGAIDAGIARITERLKGREQWMIPILMGIFAAGGTVYGMAEETIPFYALLIPVMIAAGYDAVTGVAIIMVGAGIGCLGSTINPFATVIASNAAGVSFTDGQLPRVIILVLGWLACVVYVMRYAARVKANPPQSLVADQRIANEKHFLGHEGSQTETVELTGRRKLILTLFGLSFAVMMWGVSVGGWWMAEISALFLVSSIVIGLVGQLSEEELTTTFVNGARDLLGVALIIALARGIVVIMDQGNITHTILYGAEQMVSGLPGVAFINAVYWLEMALSFLVPSSSGLAVLSMPVLAPLADFVNVSRELVVTAYQSASGLPNLITPTSGVVMGGLAIGRVSYSRWVKFMCPLLAILVVIVTMVLSVSAML
ncbi:MAG: C4-dicarboxylate ABC transporter [Oceanospirillales bacterium LUC14_002_19_P2]|nr:MAG: C4-dicarboxylate ABC transporter [Oceanospirillales bacterium LUC14_002_19_P2]